MNSNETAELLAMLHKLQASVRDLEKRVRASCTHTNSDGPTVDYYRDMQGSYDNYWYCLICGSTVGHRTNSRSEILDLLKEERDHAR